jgi:PAS domain S-box-containing protein
VVQCRAPGLLARVRGDPWRENMNEQPSRVAAASEPSSTASEKSPRLRSWFLPLAAGWTILIVALAGWNFYQDRLAVLAIIHSAANDSFNKDILFRHWASIHGGVYVPITDLTPPNPYLAHVPDRDITTPSGKKLTLMNPAYMTRQIHELAQLQSGVRGHITSLKPTRPENAADEWEAKALLAFERGEKEVSSLGLLGNENYLRLMRPLVVEKECLKCHASQGYQVGDVRGGISVSVPWTPIQGTLLGRLPVLFATYGSIWAIGILGLCVFQNRLQRHLSRLQQAAWEREKLSVLRQGINLLQQSFLEPAPLEGKLKKLTDGIVRLFDADFCRVWLIRPGDLCQRGCIHAETPDESQSCRCRDYCLHMLAGSGRQTHFDGQPHNRVPYGCYKIGAIASGEYKKFLTNDAQNDPGVHDRHWARELGIVSLAGYQLRDPQGDTLGVMVLFAKHPIDDGEDAMLDGLSGTIALVIQQVAAEEALRKMLDETERVNRLMQGRETRIVALKQEINALRAELGHASVYKESDQPAPGSPGVRISTTSDAGDAACGDNVPPAVAALPATIHYPVRDLGLEKPEVDIAFIPILCAAPLLYAKTHGYFARNGLDVRLTAAPGWSGVKDLLAFGHTDAAHLLSPMPLAMREGLDGRRAEVRLACIQNVNGQALTLAKRHAGIKDVRDMKGFTFGVPYCFSMQYYLLCLYLAEHGLDPLGDVQIIEISPPRMPHFLETGRVDGVFAPEPFNQIPVNRGTGFIHTLSKNIWHSHPCCCFASTEEFIAKNPKTYRALLRSVLEAELGLHRASPSQRRQVAIELCQPGILDQPDPEPVAQALSGEYDDGMGRHCVDHDRIDFLPTPWPEYGGWILSQQQRWKQLCRRVDYRAVVERCFDATTRDVAKALGFEEPAPSFNGIETFRAGDAFGSMRSQPFSAFQERGETELLPLPQRIARLSDVLAAAAGGRETCDIEPQADDAFGELEQLADDLLTNIRFTQDSLHEQKETLERRVQERLVEIEQTRRNAVSIAEDAEASRAQYEQVVAMISDVVWRYEVDSQGRFVASYISPVADRLLGLPDGTIGNSFDKYFSHVDPEDVPFLQGLLRTARMRLGEVVAEYRLRKSDGTMLWVRSKGSTHSLPDGHVASFGTTTDITERRRAEQQIQEYTTELESTNKALEEAKYLAEGANRAKSVFLANMSHEIRTPMTAILGFADIMLEENIGRATREHVEVIKRNGKHLLGLINNILDLSKVEVGKMEIEPARCSPRELVAEVVQLMQVRAAAKQLKLTADLTGPLPETVLTDALRLRQVLVNLVGNAIKFTDRGEVRIAARLVTDVGPSLLRFDVIDTGIGMTEDQVSELFQPFTQVDSSSTRKFGGTGLGLCISKRLAEALGGTIEVRSEPGKGSTFSVVVDPGPLAGIRMLRDNQEPADQRSPSAAPLPAGKIILHGRILVAEDGLDNMQLISRVLTLAGAEVVAVENGRLAVESALAARVAGQSFDVILMDMQMPVMDGYDATRQLRDEGYTGAIIALTAHSMAEDRQKCLDAGCDDYATKPIDRQQLLGTVARWASAASTFRPPTAAATAQAVPSPAAPRAAV